MEKVYIVIKESRDESEVFEGENTNIVIVTTDKSKAKEKFEDLRHEIILEKYESESEFELLVDEESDGNYIEETENSLLIVEQYKSISLTLIVKDLV